MVDLLIKVVSLMFTLGLVALAISWVSIFVDVIHDCYLILRNKAEFTITPFFLLGLWSLITSTIILEVLGFPILH